MNNTPGYWQVALLSAPYATYTYTEPEYLSAALWSQGLRVLVPMGGSTRLGVLVRRSDTPPDDLPDAVNFKSLLWPVEDESLLDAEYMLLAENLATRQMEPVGRVLENLLPLGVRAVTFSFRVYDSRFPAKLTPKALRELSDAHKASLAELWADGRMRVQARRKQAKEQEYCSLTKDPPWAVRPSAVRQMEILEYLWDKGPTARPTLLADLGSRASSALNTLVGNALVSIGDPPAFHEPEACSLGEGAVDVPTLTPEQDMALKNLLQALDQAEARPRLVYGVTGSGKTLIYLTLAQRALETGRSVLLLAPEVALACALYRAASDHFPGRDVRLYHGYQQNGVREQTFVEATRAKEPMVVVGTRSALFLPLRSPGLVVLDEEHDTSFKQEERMPYQAKEVAHFRMQQTGGLLVLGSATPDVKTFHAAGLGAVSQVTLKNRVGNRELPPVELVDLRDHPPAEGPFSAPAAQALKDVVAAGDQAIILLNRRGYAPVMYCLDCGKTARCAQCDVGLTYHKARERLVCHYCGSTEKFPKVCECGCSNWLPMGEGTEHLEETLLHLLPADAGVLRLDRDSTRRPGRMEAILDAFARREAQVLVGTQMLSKGHHFPGVTLVTVADGDLGLSIPDYRAAERMFQLMVQVAGRAGRGDKPGKVLIQTRSPEHYCWKYVQDSDYEGFFNTELELRRKYSYPPFTRLGLLRFNFPVKHTGGEQTVMQLVKVLSALGRELGVMVLGPAPSPLSMLRGRLRYQCLLKGSDWPALRSMFAAVRQELAGQRSIRVSLDLDPVNML